MFASDGGFGDAYVLVCAEFFDVVFVLDACDQGSDERRDIVICHHLGLAGFFHSEEVDAQRKDLLMHGGAGTFDGDACGDALRRSRAPAQPRRHRQYRLCRGGNRYRPA